MNHIIKYFYCIMTILILLFVILLFCNPMGDQLNVFFLKTNNFLADFFNVQIYISDWDPYHNTINGLGEKCYLPITYLFLELFNGFYTYSGANLIDCYSSSTAMTSCILLMAVSALLLFHSLNCIYNISWRFISIIFFSSIFLFSVERGNLALICVALICYFIAYKDSPNKWIRYIAYSCLCLASMIKIYPAIIGLYLLKEKRFKAVFGCIALSLVLSFLPFFVFHGGISNVTQLLENVAANSESYNAYRFFPRFGLAHFFAFGFNILQIDRSLSDLLLFVPKIMVSLSVLISLLLFFIERIQWKLLALVVLPLVMFPTNSAFYCGLYFFPVILLFLNNNEDRRLDYVYMILFCILLNPIQIVIHALAISWMLSNLAMLILWLLLIIDCCKSWQKRVKVSTHPSNYDYK